MSTTPQQPVQNVAVQNVTVQQDDTSDTPAPGQPLETIEYWNSQRSIYGTIRGSVCEPTGKPSAHRMHMMSYGAFGMFIIGLVVIHMVRIQDKMMLEIWMAALPTIIWTVIALVASAFSVGQASELVSKYLDKK